MKYLKVTPNFRFSYSTIEELANSIRQSFMLNENDVEVCKDEPQEIKKVEVGTLDIGEGMFIGIKESQCDFFHGDLINLSNHPELRRHCDKESIKTKWNFDGIKYGTLVVVECETCSVCGYFQFYNSSYSYVDLSMYTNGANTRVYLTAAKSIRIVEGLNDKLKEE